MKSRKIIYYFILAILLFVHGCDKTTETNIEKIINKTSEYEKISQQQIKQILDNNIPYVLLDVRFESEYEKRHLPNTTLIPVTELSDKAESILDDKDVLILVYCESGARSKTAAEELIQMGYNYVKDIGGIDSWPYDKE